MAKVTTGERLAKLETQMEHVIEDIEEVKDLIHEQDTKFANKWVEKIMIGLITFILISVIGAILALILI